jgi:hypothetical protein
MHTYVPLRHRRGKYFKPEVFIRNLKKKEKEKRKAMLPSACAT